MPSRAPRFFEPAGSWTEALGAFQSPRCGQAVRRISAHRPGRATTAVTDHAALRAANLLRGRSCQGADALWLGGHRDPWRHTEDRRDAPSAAQPRFLRMFSNANPMRNPCETPVRNLPRIVIYKTSRSGVLEDKSGSVSHIICDSRPRARRCCY